MPGASSITDSHFTTALDASYLSRNIPLFWQNEIAESVSESFFGVDFYRQIDAYALNIRAVKYAIIFLRNRYPFSPHILSPPPLPPCSPSIHAPLFHREAGASIWDAS
ncbi:MAG: inner membrane CreD family protein [Treponema sp.]|nr:inner membrane CreD family protein [Treponema sp.]